MRINISRNKLVLILTISVTINLLVFVVDTIPLFKRKIESIYFQEVNTILEQPNPEKSIVYKSLEMAKSDNPIMVWDEDELKQKGFTQTLFNLRFSDKPEDYKIFNYPRAFLYYGLSEYFIKSKDVKSLKEFKVIFDELIDINGNPKFKFDKVDQVPFGLASLNLYKSFKEDKYLKFSNFIFIKLNEMKNENGVVLYRKNSSMQFNDVLGMIVPFLLQYEKVKLDGESLKMAKNQLDFYIKNGVEKKFFLPTHGIQLDSKIKIGSSNWGRGIGWYLLGLSSYYKETGEYELELRGLLKTLNDLKNKEGLWTQFPGSSDNFDASPTTMFMYSLNSVNHGTYSKSDVINLLGKYISKEGQIKFTSGDTYGINNYNTAFGYSELSQGVLLLLLSTTK